MIDEFRTQPPPAVADEAFRRILMDLRDEYARHVAHADLLRESADALVGENPHR